MSLHPVEPAVRVHTVELDDPSPLLGRLPDGAVVSWVREGEGIVGWGEAARFETQGPERFSRAQRWWTEYCSGLAVDDHVGLPGTGPVAFCSFTFDSGPGTSVVLVPKVILGRRDGRTWITTIGPVEATRPVSAPTAHGEVVWRDGSSSPEAWIKSVAAAIERINAGELDKVVLARDLIADTDRLDPRHLLLGLAEEFPSCWTFAVDGLVGATPELLIRRSGSTVTSRVLAGTVKSRGDDSDVRLAAALLGSDKDLEEHEYAVGSVASALAAHCADLDVPARPHVLRLANVQHLATDVTGMLVDRAPALALAASLHPTAAVCGTPTERASALIRDLEGMDRQRYAGPVGWVDSHGDGELGIALRCGQIEDGPNGPGSRMRLFAGCGIVSGSQPEAELAESTAKFEAVRRVLA